MSLENYTGFIGAFVVTNPTGADPKSEGDNHLRGIKDTLVVDGLFRSRDLGTANGVASLDATGDVPASQLGNVARSSVCDFRLTLTSGVPVTPTDVISATTIFCTPYKGNQIALFNGSVWNARTSPEFSLALGTLVSGLPYDVFCFDNAGTPTLEFAAWTNGTIRAVALVRQDGILSKTGALTRRYLGTFCTTLPTQTEDSLSKRFLWNYYNRVLRSMRVIDATASWAQDNNSWGYANANANNKLEYVCGVDEDGVQATVSVLAKAAGIPNSAAMATGIGVDVTNAIGGFSAYQNNMAATSQFGIYGSFEGSALVGKHFLAWLIWGVGGTTFFGVSTASQSGISGRVFA